jgi:hypothetical protein
VTLAPVVWNPHPGQQWRFLQSNADEALFGGAAGPGKTECLLMEGLRQIANPAYRAIIFRRIFPSLEAADGLIDRSLRFYPSYGGRYNGSKHVWIFPTGARIYFGHMQYEKDKHKYQGAQFSYIGFDELTEFSEDQYLYMFSRNRAAVGTGLRCYIRSATNPGNIGHAWVKRRFVTRDIVNQKKYFAILDGEDVECLPDHPHAVSRAYYPAVVSDNPSISEDYIRNLNALSDPVEKARLLSGDWDAEHTEGRVYPNWGTENITSDADYNPDKPINWGCDDGYVHGKGPGHVSYHPRVILFWQDNELGGINIFNEMYVTGEDHAATIDRALEMGYPRPRLVWVDGSAAMFRGELSKAGIHNANGTHIVVEGIRNVRNMICDGNGVRLIRVHPRCQSFIYEMGVYRTDPNDRNKAGEPLPLKVDDHGPDTLRYIAWHKRNLRPK